MAAPADDVSKKTESNSTGETAVKTDSETVDKVAEYNPSNGDNASPTDAAPREARNSARPRAADEDVAITLYLGVKDRALRRTSRWLLVVQPDMTASDATEHREADPSNNVVDNEDGRVEDAPPAEIHINP